MCLCGATVCRSLIQKGGLLCSLKLHYVVKELNIAAFKGFQSFTFLCGM